jgi:hypothetical protein
MYNVFILKLEKVLLSLSVYYLHFEITKKQGGVAQMVERSLSMREVRGSIPRTSKYFLLFEFPF